MASPAARTCKERIAPGLPGYRGMGPVRVGNQAHLQVQNDVYGSVILAATHAFFDRRLPLAGDRVLFERLEELGRLAVAVFDQPDAGPWELRNKPAVHTFSAVMCWAGCDRLARIAAVLDLPERAAHWRQAADRLHARSPPGLERRPRAASSPPSRAITWTPACCCCTSWISWPRTIRALPPPSMPSAAT